MKPICACPMCRRGVRLLIEETFLRERCWLGRIGIAIIGRLCWVPGKLLAEVIDEMCDLGILIEMVDRPKEQKNPIPMYILARLTVPVKARKRGDP